MPEGDTIAKLARHINTTFGHEPVLSYVPRHPRIANTRLNGRALLKADSYGKLLLLRFDNGQTLHSHLGIDGSWHIGASPRAAAHDRRCEIGFPSGVLTAVSVADIGVIPTSEESRLTEDLGPNLCGDEPPPLEVATQRLRTLSRTKLAAALLDQGRLAGFGNVFAIELPFLFGVSPHRSVGTIDDLDRLVRAGIALIRWSASGHPRNTTGRSLHRVRYYIYDPDPGQRCPVCGSELSFASAEQTEWSRRSWWCPQCQSDDHTVADTNRADRLLALHPALRQLPD